MNKVPSPPRIRSICYAVHVRYSDTVYCHLTSLCHVQYWCASVLCLGLAMPGTDTWCAAPGPAELNQLSARESTMCPCVFDTHPSTDTQIR
eukprot:3287210-Rhodomonas_salina.2